MRDYEELMKALRETRETVRGDPGLAMRVPPYQLSAAADAIEELTAIKEKDAADGRLVVLDDRTALAIAAGARAIRGNKRLVGATYVYDVFGKNGGPYEISYHEASEILAAIWDAYPLPGPSGGDE